MKHDAAYYEAAALDDLASATGDLRKDDVRFYHARAQVLATLAQAAAIDDLGFAVRGLPVENVTGGGR